MCKQDMVGAVFSGEVNDFWSIDLQRFLKNWELTVV